MTKSIDELIPERPEGQLRIYAYAIHDEQHKGWLKVGQTTQNVKTRVAQQVKTAAVKNYAIEIDESALRPDGTFFRDFDVRERLKAKGFSNPTLEWMECNGR